MQQKRWFIISYDIAHPARLRRVHRLVNAEATALLEGTLNGVAKLQTALAREIDVNEDSLLIYPIRSEYPLQRWGTACLPEGIYDFTLPPLIEHRTSRELITL